MGVIFGVKKYADSLTKIIKERNIQAYLIVVIQLTIFDILYLFPTQFGSNKAYYQRSRV